MSGRFIAVVGPSGVGKDSVMSRLAARDHRFVLARRVITRPEGADGEDFDRVSEVDFAAMEAQGAFALSWHAHGLRYGIPATVDTHVASGSDVLANLSRSVLLQAKERFADLTVVVLSADRDALSARLHARGREEAADIARRLARADFALPEGLSSHAIDNSGALEDTVTAVLAQLYPVRA